MQNFKPLSETAFSAASAAWMCIFMFSHTNAAKGQFSTARRGVILSGAETIPLSVFLFTSPNLYTHADLQKKKNETKEWLSRIVLCVFNFFYKFVSIPGRFGIIIFFLVDMDAKRHYILIKGENKTANIERIEFSNNCYSVHFSSSEKVYLYGRDNVLWLTNPVEQCAEHCRIYINGELKTGIRTVRIFSEGALNYYSVEYFNGFVKQYTSAEMTIRTSCLDGKAAGIYDYLKQCAGINTLGVDPDNEDDAGILQKIYSQSSFVDEESAASAYLLPERAQKSKKFSGAIFPFGCNGSQLRAVQAALSNKVSVIQGPPGTGKTQTILNIIANLLIADKTVLVVSNNNSATGNVLEKLAKNGMAFVAAPLGNKENKEAFIANQPEVNREIEKWQLSMPERLKHGAYVKNILLSLERLFVMQERLASARQELASVEIEKTHFEKENSIGLKAGSPVAGTKVIVRVLELLKLLGNGDDAKDFLGRIKAGIQHAELFFKLRYRLKIKSDVDTNNVHKILSEVEYLFYESRISELRNEISCLQQELSKLDASELMKMLTEESMICFKAGLAKRFNNQRRRIADLQELYHTGESVLRDYPVVLSTTFSARMCFKEDLLFDYVIMDEASQVGIDTGFLALTCAKNAVIVGDMMQLPNVITDEDLEKLSVLKATYGIPDAYDVSKHSFLSSVLTAMPKVSETLLREHYRCNPDIINFCNEKFYGGNLLIMTERKDDDVPFVAIRTAPGNHARGHYNQREIDAVKKELLPMLGDCSDIGIISPYNRQVEEFRRQMPELEAATVHKYQGREKDTIIMSVTDDDITEFSDNANLLNVAVSRAKKCFCLVVSGNPQSLKGNIHDLIEYIQYRRGTVIQSKLHSIYDYLHSEMRSMENGDKISEYRSENLTYELIETIRKTVPALSHIKVLCHYPLRSLIGDTSGLSSRERSYVLHSATHVDFLIINRVSKEPLLAIETDGFAFHNRETEQYQRDRMKDKILESYGLRLLRLSTVGHGEKERIISALL